MKARLPILLIFLVCLILGMQPNTSAWAADVICDAAAEVGDYNQDVQGDRQSVLRINTNSCEQFDFGFAGVPTALSTLATTDSPVLATRDRFNHKMFLHWRPGGNIQTVTLNNVDITAQAGTDVAINADSNTIVYEHSVIGTRRLTFDLQGMNVFEQFVAGVSITVTTPLPDIQSVAPNSTTLGGGNVVITGENFTAASVVQFDGVNAVSFTVDSSTQITAVAPPRNTAGAVTVSVTNPGGTQTEAGHFSYTAGTPTATNITPATGTRLGGTTITITGTNLTGTTAVTVGGVAATNIVVVSDTEITAVTPAGALGAANVQVTAPGGAVLANTQFTYIADAPTIAKIDPNSGTNLGGTTVTISGTNLTGTTAVSIGGTAATNIVVVSDTEITAVTPAGSVGAADVQVTTPIGTIVANGLFTYTESTEKTREIIASFLQDRATNLLNTRPDITGFLYAPTAGGRLGNLQLNANAEGFNLSFASSLGRIMQVSEQLPDNAQRSSDTNGFDQLQLAGEDNHNYDLWVQIHGAKTTTTEANSTLWVGQFGGHVFLNENTLVGAMAQVDWADQTQRTTTGGVDGIGWMVGPYIAAKVPDQSLALDAFVTWGRSDNNVSPDGTYTDSFATERWMANASLSGLFEANGWSIQPAIEVSYYKETQFSYVDSQNNTIPEQSISLGELRFGPTVSKQWELEDGTLVRPSVGVAGVWNFAVNKEGLFPTTGLTSNDVRARFEVGLAIGREDDWALNVSGYYDGVGTEGFESYGGKVRLTIPLP